MKILFQSRQTLYSVPGGDTTQILKTADALRSLGHLVDVNLELEPDVSNYDIVHLFNITRPQETFLQAKNAKYYGKPVVLSPIFVDYSESDRVLRTGISGLASRTLPKSSIEYLKILARMIFNKEVNKGSFVMLSNGYSSLQKKLLFFSDVLLPNSYSERERLIQEFGIQIGNKISVIVPNGIDRNLFFPELNNGNYIFEQKKADTILCVARIERLKNQLNLVKAMVNLPWDLNLIGKIAPNHKKYFSEVKAASGENVHYLGWIDHSHLPGFYQTSKVHVLPSWMETTGLTSLEAGAMGCNLVITDKGDTREYFQNYAFYCDPGDIHTIRDAIIKAYNAPYPNNELRNFILSNYTWEQAGLKTIEGYKLAIDLKKN